MEILCIGLNHETAPVAVRERLALTGDSLQETLQWLKGQPAVQEALVLSTCNRTEIYVKSAQGEPHGVRDWLRSDQQLNTDA